MSAKSTLSEETKQDERKGVMEQAMPDTEKVYSQDYDPDTMVYCVNTYAKKDINMMSMKALWLGPKGRKGTMGIYTNKDNAKAIADTLMGTNLYKAGYADVEVKESKLSDVEWRMGDNVRLKHTVKLNLFYHMEILNVDLYDRPADRKCYETMSIQETREFYESEQVGNGQEADDKYGGDLVPENPDEPNESNDITE